MQIQVTTIGVWAGRIGRVGARLGAGIVRLARHPARVAHRLGPAIERPSVIVAAGLVAALAAVKLFDPLMRHRPELAGGGFVRSVLEGLTWFGEGVELLIGSGVLVLALAAIDPAGLPRRLAARLFAVATTFGFVFAAIAGSGLLAALAKNLFGRARPEHLTGEGIFQIHDAVFASQWASFPSGHATTAGASAVVLALLFPRLARLFLAAGAVVAVTRVGLAAHFPSDVFAGFALGAATTVFLAHRLAARGLVFAQDAAGRLVPRDHARPQAWFDLLADLLAVLPRRAAPETAIAAEAPVAEVRDGATSDQPPSAAA